MSEYDPLRAFLTRLREFLDRISGMDDDETYHAILDAAQKHHGRFERHSIQGVRIRWFDGRWFISLFGIYAIGPVGGDQQAVIRSWIRLAHERCRLIKADIEAEDDGFVTAHPDMPGGQP